MPDIAAVVCTSGTTNAGIIDDLAGIGALAQERGWWFHVDGAYGGSGIFARSLRPKYDGLEQADSFILDPHKWLFTPFDCCALLYRDPRTGARHPHPGRVVPRRHPRHRRRVESVGLRLPPDPTGPGTAAVVLAGGVRTGGVPRRPSRSPRRSPSQTAELIKAAPQLELIREPDLGVVLFRRLGWKPEDYDAWAQRLHDDQVAFIPPTKWEGETVGRFAFLHPDTSLELVREVLARTE